MPASKLVHCCQKLLPIGGHDFFDKSMRAFRRSWEERMSAAITFLAREVAGSLRR